jgi:hypothetical protein
MVCCGISLYVMNFNPMNKLLLILLFFSSLVQIGCKSKPKFDYNYEMVCQYQGKGGSYFLKVFTYGKDEQDAIRKAKYSVIHGVLFKGVSSGQCGNYPPICHKTYEENSKYFDDFFSSGSYLKYVNVSNDYSIPAEDRVKTPNGLKIGVMVSVNYEALKTEMEKLGYSLKLNKIF